jgi:hypothetical protein
MHATLRWTLEVGIVLVIASGCAVAHEPEEEYDERRLRVVMDRPASGEATFIGFYDPELDQLCAPRLTEDGVLRCVPDSPLGGADVSYADPSCTEPVDTIVRGCWLRYLVETAYPDACGAPSYARVFEVGEEVETTIYHRSRTGECRPGGFRTARRLTPISPRWMVRGELELRSGPNRLVADTIAWADGTRGPARIRDTARGEPCTIEYPRNGDGPAVCAPPSTAYERGFGSECAERWAVALRDGCPPSSGEVVVRAERESLSVGVVGDVVPAAERDAAPGCLLGYEGQVVYSIDPAPEGLLPSLRLEHRGEGRLQRRMWVDEDGGEWTALGYYDSELGVDCRVRSWTHERCVPTSITQLHYDDNRLFADEGCTEPAARVAGGAALVTEYVWHGSCAHVSGTISSSTGAEPARFYRYGEPLTGPLYERDETTGACSPRHFGDDASLFRLEPVDLETLAEVHRVRE